MLDQIAIELCKRLAPKVVDGIVSKRQTTRATKDRQIAEQLGQLSLKTSRVTVVAELQRRGLRDVDAEEVMESLRSDAGIEAVRQIVIYDLAVAANAQSRKSLNNMVAIFLALDAGKETSSQRDAAEVLISTLIESITALRAQLKASPSGREALHELQQEARHRRLETSLLGEMSVNSRTTRLRTLIASNVEISSEHEADYADALSIDTSEITIPTLVTKQVSVPIDVGYVNPTLTFLEEQDEVGSKTLHDYVVRRRHVVVLGDPGAGKSTGLKSLAREFLAEYRDSAHKPIPFIVTLRHFSRARQIEPQLGFIEFISRNLEKDYHSSISNAHVTYLLHVGRAAVLFDGFDEILDFDLRKEIAALIAKISHAFPSSIFVTSAREVGYDQNPIPRLDNKTWLGPFDKHGVLQFVQTYLATVEAPTDLSADEFLTETAGIADLRANPLLLGVLCSLYSSGRTMPNNRAELYAKCGEMIFDAWDTQKSLIIPFDHRQLAEDAVRALALKTFSEGQEEIAESDLRQFLQRFYTLNVSTSPAAASQFASVTLERWRGRMWVLVHLGAKDGVDYFRFAHRSFLEFFAAQQTVYDSEDSGALWHSLSDRFERRVAISYALLCVELMGNRSRGSLDAFFQAAAARMADLRETNKALQGLHLATSTFDALACTRGNPPPRRAAITEGIKVFAQTIPSIQLSDPNHLESLYRGIGYSALANDSGENQSTDYINDEKEDDEGEEYFTLSSLNNITIQGAASIFRSLGRLRAVDRDDAVESLRTVIGSMKHENVERTLRLVMTMQQVPALESWGDVDDKFRKQLVDVASELWAELTSGLTSRSVTAIEDLWLRIALLRDGKAGWGDLKKRTRMDIFFESGWPFPVDRQNGILPHHGPSVHLVVQALLGVHDPQQIGQISESQSDFLEFTTSFDYADQEYCFSVEANRVPGFSVRRGGEFRRSEVVQISNAQLWVAVCLLVALDRLGDRVFIESLIDSLRGSVTLTRMIDLQDLVCCRESMVMYSGVGSEIALRNESQVAECLTFLNIVSELAGPQN